MGSAVRHFLPKLFHQLSRHVFHIVRMSSTARARSMAGRAPQWKRLSIKSSSTLLRQQSERKAHREVAVEVRRGSIETIARARRLLDRSLAQMRELTFTKTL